MSVTTEQILRTGLAAPHLFGHEHSGGEYRVWRHVEHIGRAIARAVRAGNGRLIINLGPRTGKSELISFWTPGWFIGRWPDRRVILGTNTSDLADRYGGRVRNLFEDNPALGVTIQGDSGAKADWMTTRGGGMKAVGIGKSILGFGAHLFIIDDPYATWADAQSSTTRKAVAEWYRGTASNRLEPGGSVIVLHHRMHPQDLTDTLLKGEDGARWQVISLPSLALDNDPMGRAPGEALCPERYDARSLAAIRREMQGMFEPMHQQNPLAMAAGGAYPHFGQHNLDAAAAFNPALPLDLSVDFNIVPGMHMYMGQFDPVGDLAWVFDEIHRQNMNVEGAAAEFCRRVAAMPVKPKAIHLYGDAAGEQRSVQTSQTHYDTLLRGLAPCGIPVSLRYPRSNPPVSARLMTVNHSMKDLDGAVHYKVHPRCERLVRDYAGVQLDSKGGIDKSEPGMTHASDAEGYRLHQVRGFQFKITAPKGVVIGV